MVLGSITMQARLGGRRNITYIQSHTTHVRAVKCSLAGYANFKELETFKESILKVNNALYRIKWQVTDRPRIT